MLNSLRAIACFSYEWKQQNCTFNTFVLNPACDGRRNGFSSQSLFHYRNFARFTYSVAYFTPIRNKRNGVHTLIWSTSKIPRDLRYLRRKFSIDRYPSFKNIIPQNAYKVLNRKLDTMESCLTGLEPRQQVYKYKNCSVYK